MPIYEYRCKSCGHEFDELQSIKEKPLIKCPNCSKDALARLIGTGSSVIFKGSGFYQTDYKKTSSTTPSKSSSSQKDKDSGVIHDSKDKTKTEPKSANPENKKPAKKESKNK